MTRTKKLSAGIAVVALIAGGGAAVAATKLGSSSPKASLAGSNIASSGGGSGRIGSANQGTGGLGSGGLGTGELGGGGGGMGGGRFDGGDGDGGRGFDRGFGGGPFGSLGAAATYLGLSTTTLQADLQAGKSLAQVAKTSGKPVDGLIAAMAAAQKQQIDAFVSAGRLTQPQAQAIESQITRRVTAMVNGTGPAGGGSAGGFRGPGSDGGGFGAPGGGSAGGGSGTF